jgi:hypothetical protein
MDASDAVAQPTDESRSVHQVGILKGGGKCPLTWLLFLSCQCQLWVLLVALSAPACPQMEGWFRLSTEAELVAR